MIQLLLECQPSRVSRACYRLAGQIVASDRPIPAFEPFTEVSREVVLEERVDARTLRCHQQVIFAGSARMGEKAREIRCSWGPDGYALSIDGTGFFVIHQGDSDSIQILSPGGSDMDIETLSGPLLILALSFLEIWCFHASAVAIRDEAWAFLGQSGSGKSTIAHYLGSLAESSRVRWLADDLLPVSIERRAAYVLPHYPQLKIPANRQYAPASPVRLPLARVFLLSPDPLLEGNRPSLRAVPSSAIVPQLVSYMVSGRLFAPETLRQQFDFAVRLIQTCRIQQLIWPLQQTSLHWLVEEIAS